MDVRQQDIDFRTLESNVDQSFLWFPAWEDKSVEVTDARGAVYYPQEEGQKATDIIVSADLTGSLAAGYKFTFNTNGWDIGLYLLVLAGKYSKDGIEHEIRKELHFELAGIDKVHYLVWRLQNRLMDCPEFYSLDKNPQGTATRYWTYQNYYGYLKDAIDRFNESMPTISDYDIDTTPENILLQGASGFAYLTRARIEKANTFTFSDAPVIDRSEFYRSEGARVLDDFDKKARGWKTMAGRESIFCAVKRQKLPYFGVRYLSFIPAFKNII